MSLEFEGVRAGVGAVGALVGPLPRVTPHVSFQLGELHALIVTFRTLKLDQLYDTVGRVISTNLALISGYFLEAQLFSIA